jgi:2-phospho-L-lactate guanylyltransferase
VQTAVLIPLKAFRGAKARLSSVLDAGERADLARRMAETVVAAAAPCPWRSCATTTRSPTGPRGSAPSVVRVDGPGLDRAVHAGIAALAADGFEQVVVAHGDLPRATDLTTCADFDGVTLVPDRHGDGTPVAVVPVGAGFRFAYGPGSFARHVAEAERLGLTWRRLDDPDLGWDVDEPADLEFQTST